MKYKRGDILVHITNKNQKIKIVLPNEFTQDYFVKFRDDVFSWQSGSYIEAAYEKQMVRLGNHPLTTIFK